jgi:YidC/Oxa1 family membrane protein insertase
VSWNPINWLENVVSWILVQFHTLTGAIFGPSSGWAWAFAIVGLVVVIRIALIPLFVRQIKSQRNMQLLQPKIKEIQKKYAGDRERQSQEMMALYKDTGTNPLSSCLPILAQAPIFYALFQVLQGIAMKVPRGFMTPELVAQAHDATLFGVPIYATFVDAAATPLPTVTRIFTMVLIVFMTFTTFITQRQLIVKNSAKDNPMVQQQKILLYVFPVIFAVTGINFPVGVLIYWLTTNLWSMGQQFYVIRNNPQPGTPAYEAWEKREADKRARKNGGVDPEAPPPPEVAPPAPRQQPKNQSRSKRQKKPPGVAGTQSPTGSEGPRSAEPPDATPEPTT